MIRLPRGGDRGLLDQRSQSGNEEEARNRALAPTAD